MKPKRVRKGVQRFVELQVQRLGSVPQVPPVVAQQAQAPVGQVSMGSSRPSSAAPIGQSFTVGMQPYRSAAHAGTMAPAGMARQISTASEIAAGMSAGSAKGSAAPPAHEHSQASAPPPLPPPPSMTDEERQDAIEKMSMYKQGKTSAMFGDKLSTLKAIVIKGNEVHRLQLYVSTVQHELLAAGSPSMMEPLPKDVQRLGQWRDTIRSIQTYVTNPCFGQQCSHHARPLCDGVRNVLLRLKDYCFKPAYERLHRAKHAHLGQQAHGRDGRSSSQTSSSHVMDAQEGTMVPSIGSGASAGSTESTTETTKRLVLEAGQLVLGRVGSKTMPLHLQHYGKIVRHFFLCVSKDCPLACRVSRAAINREHQGRKVRYDRDTLRLYHAMQKDMLQQAKQLEQQCWGLHVKMHMASGLTGVRAEQQEAIRQLQKRIQRYEVRAKYYHQGMEHCQQEHQQSMHQFQEIMSKDKAFSESEKRAVTFQSLDPQISLLHTSTHDELRAHIYSLRMDFNAVLQPKDILDRCSPVLGRLLAKDKRLNYFSTRVNAKDMGLADYHDIIKRPMDLGTIRRRLEGKRYRSLKGFSDDVRQVWYNAILYNPPGSEVALVAEEFALYFDEMMHQVFAEAQREHSEIIQRDMHESKQRLESERAEERRQQQLLREQGHRPDESSQAQFTNNVCSLCAGQKFVFEPSMLYCTLCRKRIQRNSTFYRSNDNSAHYCTSCYGSKVPSEPQSDNSIIPKSKLSKAKHEETAEEEWVMCGICNKWMHNICVMFNRMHNELNSQTLVCPMCLMQELERRASRRSIRPTSGLRARDLPKYRLGDRIESAVHKLLLRRQVEALIGASPDSAAGSSVDDILKSPSPRLLSEASQSYPIPKVVLRVVSDSWQETKVPAHVVKRYKSHGVPAKYRHRSRALALFQELDGADVLVFTMYVQEYWDDCLGPNRRSAYLSYLDSVRYFDPPELRTLVFHEVILEYMRDLKSRGFLQLVLWACPPLKGDDYIFFCHPPDQQNPKPERLRKWYQDMFDTAHETGVVDKVVYLADDFFPAKSGSEGGRQRSMLDLPLYNGDYWPGEAESIAKELTATADTVQSSVFKGRKLLWHTHLYTDPDAKALDLQPCVPLQSASAVSAVVLPVSRSKVLAVQDVEDGRLPFRRQVRREHTQLWYAASSTRSGAAGSAGDPSQSVDASETMEDASELPGSLAGQLSLGPRNISPAVSGPSVSSLVPGSQPSMLGLGDDMDDDDDDLEGTGNSSGKKSSKRGKKKGKAMRAKRKGRGVGRVRRQSAGRESMSGGDSDAPGGSSSKAHTTKGRMINASNSHLVDDQLATKLADQLVNLRQDFFVAKLWASCQLCKTYIVSGNQWYSPEHAEQDESVNLCDACYKIERTRREGTAGRLCSDVFVRQLQCRPALTGENELEVLEELKADASRSKEAQSDSASAPMSDGEDPGHGVSSASRRSRGTRGGTAKPSRPGSPKGRASQVYEELQDLFRGRLRHDEDSLVSCEFWETRENFLELCQGNHYQFDQLRRAKHSTLMVLYHMRNPKMPSYVHVCNECNQKIVKGNRWVCDTCEEYDMCDDCFIKTQHGSLKPHKHRLRPHAVTFTRRDREAREREEMRPLVAALEVIYGVPVGAAEKELATVDRMALVRHMLTAQGASQDEADKLMRITQFHADQCTSVVGSCPVHGCNRIRATATTRVDARAAAVAERSREAAAEAQLRLHQHQQMRGQPREGSGHGHGAAAGHPNANMGSSSHAAHKQQSRGRSGTAWERLDSQATLNERMQAEEANPGSAVQEIIPAAYHTLQITPAAKNKFRSNLAMLAMAQWKRDHKGDKVLKTDDRTVAERKQAMSFDYYCTTKIHGPSLMVLLMSRLLPDYAGACHPHNPAPTVTLNHQLVTRYKSDVYVRYQKHVTQNRGRSRSASSSGGKRPAFRNTGSSGTSAAGATAMTGQLHHSADSIARMLVMQSMGQAGEGMPAVTAGTAAGTAGTGAAGSKRPRSDGYTAPSAERGPPPESGRGDSTAEGASSVVVNDLKKPRLG